jgi:hypothetical protein
VPKDGLIIWRRAWTSIRQWQLRRKLDFFHFLWGSQYFYLFYLAFLNLLLFFLLLLVVSLFLWHIDKGT